MKHTFTLLLLLLLALVSCQKDALEPVFPTIKEPANGSFIKSVTQKSARFQYELSTNAKVETGVYISTDSLTLVSARESATYFKSAYDANQKKYIADAVALEPYTTYWYIIKSEYSGTFTFTEIAKFTTLGFNIEWQNAFIKKIKLDDPVYQDLILFGDNVDTDLRNYEVMYGDMVCYLRLIAKVNTSSGRYSYHIQVPASAPIGIRKFTIYYKKKKVFEDDLEVVKGSLNTIRKVTQHPDGAADRVYFKYKDKLYTIYLNVDTYVNAYHLSIWDPATNQWERRSMPKGIELWEGLRGIEINDKIYFAASRWGFWESTTYIGFQERIYIYDPIKDTWDYHSFYTSQDSNDRLFPLESFAYEGKLYSFVLQFRSGKQQTLLKVFDPVNKSWETVMELTGAAGYSAVIIKGKIYILESQEKEHFSASISFKYVLYTLDLASKTLTKIGTPIFHAVEQGALDPAIFEYNNQLYVYGGKSIIGYLGNGTTDLYNYNPETNTWTMLYLSPNYSIPSQEHFAYVLNGKIYFGLGLTASFDWNSEIWELNLD